MDGGVQELVWSRYGDFVDGLNHTSHCRIDFFLVEGDIRGQNIAAAY